ncbi:MAG: DUF4249 domain-containing protein [Phycisphaerae bacterium]|nr:DUF4249 domain-containing protein [Saprospiraceae bacterium]
MRLIILFFIFVCLLSVRCARDVIIDLPEEPTKLVAVCHFTEGQNFRVKISLSKSVNDASEPEFLQSMDLDATLSVKGQFWDRLKPNTTDIEDITYWESNKNQKAKSGVEYAFSVRVPGYPTIQASSKIPEKTELEPIVLGLGDISVVVLSDGQSELRVPLELRVKEMPSDGHYFAFNLTHETEVFLDPQDPYTEESRTNFLTDGRTFSLLHDIPEPVVLINENYWADDRRTLYLLARIPFDPASERPRLIFIEWRTLSEQFYRYHLSLSRQGSNLPFSDPDAVFNNIEGGYGNFSGYAVSMDTVLIPNF